MGNKAYFACLLDWRNRFVKDDDSWRKFVQAVLDTKNLSFLGELAPSRPAEVWPDWEVRIAKCKNSCDATEAQLGITHSRLMIAFDLKSDFETVSQIRPVRRRLEATVRKFLEKVKSR